MFALDEKVHSIDELDDILSEAMQEGTQTSKNNITYWKFPCSFDIETTSFTDKITREDHNEKRSIMYAWGFGINGHVIIGREWSEFMYLINRVIEVLGLSKYTRILCYIHNAAFEFEYIRGFFEWHKVFAIDKRKPIYFITTSGIEFRCSYILTNYSLEKLGDQLQKYKVRKLVGQLDYSLYRHPQTPMTDSELSYLVNDNLVVMAYIQEQIEREKYIHKIPLTCTGYCRRFVRKNCLYGPVFKRWRRQFRNYHNFMKGLQIKDYDEYCQLKRAFQGGFTHASMAWSNLTIRDVDHLDFTSSYPYVLLSEQFPMSTAREIDASKITQEQFEIYLKCYCCLFDIKFHNLRPKPGMENYLAVYKCWLKLGVIENNGRVYSASMVATTITETDLKIINAVYDYDYIEVSNMKIYEKGYLPIEIIKSIIKLYQDKTTLKGVKGKENEYLVSKGLLNSVYGMMVTDIVREEIVYENGERSTQKPDAQHDLDKYNKSRRRFLLYHWGVWCTCFARRNLFYGLCEFCRGSEKTKFTGTLYYCDTDSLFVGDLESHKPFIDRYNKLCEDKLRKMCEHYGLDYEKELLPRTIKGEVKPLGVWDQEPHIEKFKTLGAKRYMTLIDGELSITVSGVNKKFAVPWLVEKVGIEGAFEAFEEGLVVPEAATGKLTHYYIDKPYEGDIVDYLGNKYHYYAPSGVYLEKTSYSFDISIEYINFLKGVFYTK